MSKPASRLLTLILLLQRQPNQKASDLAGALGISVRSLHRYMEMLDEMGIPVYTERGPAGGFSLVRGYRMPPLVFTPEEAAAVSLGAGLVEEIWGELYREAAQSALAKLENLLPEQQRGEVKWARHSLVTAGLLHPSQAAVTAVLENLRRAMRTSRQVEMVYASASGARTSTRRLDPYAIAFHGGWWYVVGHCHTRHEVRTFRVDRIQDLSEKGASFQPPMDFEAREFLAKFFKGQPQVQARLRFKSANAHIARTNRATWDSYEEHPDGSVEVTLSAPDLIWAASSALVYGPAVEVLAPSQLRRLLGEWARAILELYSTQGE
jgi:predicted DNA-binding transcriptional regulator YafY